jgi:beta-phosphoglucomutase-like phosphatase (HAD superfamily)
VPVEHCVVVGDIGADIEAARRAGTYGVLVPTPVTRPEEIAAAPHVAPDLLTAVRGLLAGEHATAAVPAVPGRPL